MECLGQLFGLLLMTGIEVFRAEINFGINPVLNRKIDPLEEHRVRDIDVNCRHRSFLITPNPKPPSFRG
jgi:hypothetical protein